MKPVTEFALPSLCPGGSLLFERQDDEGEVLAYFGKARLIKKLDGKLELVGGTDEDRTEAREWISLFLHS